MSRQELAGLPVIRDRAGKLGAHLTGLFEGQILGVVIDGEVATRKPEFHFLMVRIALLAACSTFEPTYRAKVTEDDTEVEVELPVSEKRAASLNRTDQTLTARFMLERTSLSELLPSYMGSSAALDEGQSLITSAPGILVPEVTESNFGNYIQKDWPLYVAGRTWQEEKAMRQQAS